MAGHKSLVCVAGHARPSADCGRLDALAGCRVVNRGDDLLFGHGATMPETLPERKRIFAIDWQKCARYGPFTGAIPRQSPPGMVAPLASRAA